MQFAKTAGARVLATASAGNLPTLSKLGADVAIDYRRDDAAEIALAETDGHGVDAAFDIEGEEIVGRTLPGVRTGGRIACILPPRGDLAELYQRTSRCTASS